MADKPALRVLAHFQPGERAREQIAQTADWLDVRFVPEDDDDAFYRDFRRRVDEFQLVMELAAERMVPHLMRFAVRTPD